MILDEPLTAMIPPPDLWGSTGYTANNNKVGLKKVQLQYFKLTGKNVLRKERSRRRAGARFAQPGAKR